MKQSINWKMAASQICMGAGLVIGLAGLAGATLTKIAPPSTDDFINNFTFCASLVTAATGWGVMLGGEMSKIKLKKGPTIRNPSGHGPWGPKP